MSGLINKVKDALSKDDKTYDTTGTAPTGAPTHRTTGVGHPSGTHAGTTSTTAGSTNAGPHSSNVANKADPRVDSDLGETGQGFWPTPNAN